MTWTVIIVLMVVGFLFLLLEVLVLPGTNVAGVIGFILVAIGIWQTYEIYGTTAGTILLISTLIISMLSLFYLLKSRTWKKATLEKQIDSRVNIIDGTKIKVSDTGKTISRLVPTGKAIINGEYYEVKTTGEFLDHNTEIEIVKIEHNKIIVKPKIKK